MGCTDNLSTFFSIHDLSNTKCTWHQYNPGVIKCIVYLYVYVFCYRKIFCNGRLHVKNKNHICVLSQMLAPLYEIFLICIVVTIFRTILELPYRNIALKCHDIFSYSSFEESMIFVWFLHSLTLDIKNIYDMWSCITLQCILHPSSQAQTVWHDLYNQVLQHSYLIMFQTYNPKSSNVLAWDVHFWIGKYSSQVHALRDNHSACCPKYCVQSVYLLIFNTMIKFPIIFGSGTLYFLLLVRF